MEEFQSTYQIVKERTSSSLASSSLIPQHPHEVSHVDQKLQGASAVFGFCFTGSGQVG
jgi:hypothetical protein